MQIRRVEQHKAEHDDQQHIAPPQKLRQFLQGRYPFFQQQHQGKQQPPQDEIPAGTVPQACQHPDHQNVEHPASPADPVSAHGNVDVIPEPGAKAHVPAAPEFGNTLRQVRIVEVFDEMKAENPPQTDGHIGIAGKVEVDVQHKGNGIHPVEQNALFRGIPENFRQQAQLVGKEHLFAQTHEEPTDACHGIVQG